MTIPRFYISTEELHRGRLVLDGQDHHHMSRVLRMRPGQTVTVLDGHGGVGMAEISDIAPSETIVVVGEINLVDEERPRIHLCQAFPQSRKMDYVIQSMVELGVSSIRPFSCHRSRPLGVSGKGRLERWRRIAVESSRLAGRPYLPDINDPLVWEEMLQSLGSSDYSLYADEDGGRRPARVLGEGLPVDVCLVIGPEGGFTDGERSDLTTAGASAVTLGRNVLRTESAGTVLAAAVRCHYGLL